MTEVAFIVYFIKAVLEAYCTFKTPINLLADLNCNRATLKQAVWL